MAFEDRQRGALHAPHRIVHQPDSDSIRRLLMQTGYSIQVTPGQRKYGDPPPNSVPIYDVPVDDATVFCGGFPNNVFEDTLVPLFETCGVIWELRIMLDKNTGINKGYGFVTYTTADAAAYAVEILDGFIISPSAQLTVSKCIPNNRLFIGNIPRNRSRKELRRYFGRVTVGLKRLWTFGYTSGTTQNRGFCFLEYESHKTASVAKNRLGNGNFKVWGYYITAKWADQPYHLNTHIMHLSKIIFVRNIPPTMSELALKSIFRNYGRIIRVKKSCTTSAIVQFADRFDALYAIGDLKEKFMRDFNIELILAIPPLNTIINRIDWSNQLLSLVESESDTRNRHSLVTYAAIQTPESSLMEQDEDTRSFASTSTYNYNNYGYQFYHQNNYYGQHYYNNLYYYYPQERMYQTQFVPGNPMPSPYFNMDPYDDLLFAERAPCGAHTFFYITLPMDGYYVNNRYYCSCGCELIELQIRSC